MLSTFLPARVTGVSTPARGERLDGALVSREVRAPASPRGEAAADSRHPTHATVQVGVTQGTRPSRIQYQLEKREGRWLIVNQKYL